MDKLLKYSLSGITACFLLITACNNNTTPTEKKLDLSEFSKEEKRLILDRLNNLKPNNGYFQGGLRADKILDTLMLLEPTNSDHHHTKSVGHSKIGNYHIAFPLLEEAVKINPPDILYYYPWLLLYYYHDYERALKYFNEFDDLTPNQVDFAMSENVYYLKGMALKQLGRDEEAIASLTQAVKSDGENVDPYVHVYRGICYLQQKKYDAAIADFDFVLNDLDDPRNSMAHYYKGEAYLQKGSIDKAKMHFLEAQKLIEKGYVKTDPYWELFDFVSGERVKDKLESL